MLTVYNCLVGQHDLRLVGLAAFICTLASLTAISLLHHVRKSFARIRYLWLAVSATATGFGIWATHFIAMLAFSPGMPTAYDVGLTAVSLVAAIIITGVGLAVALAPGLPEATWFGGAIVGGGIATMHYTGMAAFQVEGRVIWDPLLVIASILLGAVIGAAALAVGLRGTSIKWKGVGAVLLTLAICSHHFTAMGAASIVPDPTIALSTSVLPASWLAIAVALASVVIFFLTFAGIALDLRDRRRAELESDRMRGLANAAIEGLLVCDVDTIVAANNNFASLAGSRIEDLVGTTFRRCFPSQEVFQKLLERPDHPIETELFPPNGLAIPVELILRPLDFAGKAHNAIAVRDLRARKAAEQHIRFLAHHDTLTGLPNRSSFNKRLDQEIEAQIGTSNRLAVLCLDLDRFKEVNDLFGHAAGDKLLQSVANCVTNSLDDNQMMARLGGDEFAIILPTLSDPTVAGRVAESLLQALRRLRENSTDGAFASTSIGIAICPNDGQDRQVLLSHADTALYRAKAEGRDTYRFFEESMGAAMHDRRQLEHDLRRAVANQEFKLVYQPQHDIKTSEVIGFEALLRWNHPTRGQLSPDKFIPLAEESGLILGIGEWVLRTACRDAAKWTNLLTVAVNVSAVQLHNGNFAKLVHEILFHTGLPAYRLELEITETALIRDLNRALSTLRQIKGLGVRIAMDDFGTGYSSLSNLRSFPFDKLKIDSSFISAVNLNEQAATIVRAVLGLGRGLGVPVLAEGVETAAELKFLTDEHCTEVQGYFLGRPAEIDNFRHLTEADAAVISPPNVTRLSGEKRRSSVPVR
jgi:diguanylate cyclase (GGDEF)-like protein